jgi:hypothetical protein
MSVLRVVFPVLLAFLLVSSISAMAFDWWEAAEGAGAGAATGAAIGTVVPGLGTLAGAGIGALAGFIGASVPQIFGQTPSTSASFSTWYDYAKNAYESIAAQSELIADNEIDQVNLLQEAQMPFVLTAQKWEQVNFNANASPSSPYEFYEMLSQTGFLSYAAKLIGGTQSLWVDEEGIINSVNQQISPYQLSISYNVNPNATVSVYVGSGYYFIIVFGSVKLNPNGELTITTIYSNGSTLNLQTSQPVTLQSGAYVVLFSSGSTYGGYISVNPNQGAVLVFQYSTSSGQYSAVNWGFNTPSTVTLYKSSTTNMSTTLPQVPTSLPYIAEQVAVSMLGAAEAEYSVLESFGYQTAAQIPANMSLPALGLNIGNFSGFNSSIQAYNLYLAEYSRELLQLQQTLQALSQEGKLTGLQQLDFNASNPLSVYGEYGGFIENGSIVLPNGQTLKGLFLIQPYGGPLTLSSNGGIVGNGGAIAYQLVPVGNGTYALGEMYTLTPGTAIQGSVENPGTLYPVAQPHNADYLNATAPTPPPSSSSSSSSALNSIENYLLSHPLVLIGTALFVLIILVALIRALL